MKKYPEINCDLGEGIPGEPLVIPLIDVASVACGGHFGDGDSIRETLKLCKSFGKKAGAHPSYPDLDNFGRKTLDIPIDDLLSSLLNQIHLFLKVADELDLPFDHIKFHGALYNDAAAKPELANSLTDFLLEHFPSVPIFVPPHSQMEYFVNSKNLKFRLEIFGDRAYEDDFSLVSRAKSGSLLTSSDAIIRHLESVFDRGELFSISGKSLPVEAETICFHGDNPGLLEFLPIIRKRFWK
ncbi:MAG: LamB/YcsF family protein [Algoriphagus sp.]|nr:LamB/YcsF family protein [Algoriphagus sp.]